jgi:heme exporter protein D
MISGIEFSSFSEFLNMGGYAFNVWAVYGLFSVFIAINLVAPMIKRKSILKEQSRRLRQQQTLVKEQD